MQSQTKERLALFAVPAIAALLAHVWAIRDSFITLDVHYFLLDNPLTINPFGSGAFEFIATPQLGYPVPVLVLAYAAQRNLVGLDPYVFHAVSVLLHIGVVGLVYALAIRLGAVARAAAALAAIFAIHPLTVEPVTWVVGQKDLIATLLIVGALLVRAHPNGASRRRTAIAFGLAFLALFSKPSAVCVPVLFVVIDWLCDRDWRRGRLLYFSTALIGLGVIALSIWSHENFTRTGVSRAFSSRSVFEAAWAVSLQALHVFAPTDLSPRYFEPTGGTALYGGAFVGLLITGGLFGLIAWCLRRGDRLTAAGLLLFGAAYGPVAGIIPITRGPADSYMYLPLALLAAAVGPALGSFAVRSKRLAILLVAVTVPSLIALSITAHDNWSTPRKLWSALLDKYPDNPVAKLRMAQAFFAERRLDLAVAALAQIEEDHAPEFVNHRWMWADSLAMLGRIKEAETVFVLAASGRDPGELDRYGRFLVLHADLEPTNPEIAAAAIERVSSVLAELGGPPGILARAADLCDRYGLGELAAALRNRLEEWRKAAPP